ncbi:MAG: hypothetical protein PHW75_02720 [Patescibacteria group bacterium]|nr:hypothetical protein [Patescibacteria group bacterium]
MNTYLSSDYLFEIASGTTYQEYYLYVAFALIALPIILKVYFTIRNERAPYKSFDRLWFWGYLMIGVLGLFIWFSRDQGLPLFGTRLASYAWLSTIFIYLGYLLYYYKKKVTKDVVRHYEKSRKEKYLK